MGLKNRAFLIPFLVSGILIVDSPLHAQSFKVNLSPKSLTKIQKGKTAFGKLKRYHKAYSKDSARQMKKLSKQYKKKTDSISRTIAKEEKMYALMRKKGIKIPTDTLAVLKQYASLLPKYSVGLDSAKIGSTVQSKMSSLEGRQLNVLRSQYGLSPQEAQQYLQGDSAARRRIAIRGLKKVKEKSIASLPPGQRNQLESFQKQYGPYSTEAKQYAFFLKDSVDRSDTLKAMASKRAEGMANQLVDQKLGGGGLSQFKNSEKQLNEFKGMRDQYKSTLDEYKNADLKEKAEQEAKKLASHADKVQALQKSMALLKNKYSSLLNSNDLSTGVKANSLKGRPFREHWVLGGNFNIVNVSPFMIDLSPTVGYRLNKKLQIGVGAIYRASFVDSVKLINSLPATNSGYSIFVNYNLAMNFFAYAEWERTSTIVKGNSTDPKPSRQWVNSLLIGVGRQFGISKYVKGSVMLLWNPLHVNGKTPYNSDFVIKTGFRLSDLAIKK